jgi:hypothetical protein
MEDAALTQRAITSETLARRGRNPSFLAVTFLLIASVAACQKPARVVPNAAPGLELPAEDPLGDTAAATRERAITHVARQFGLATVKTLTEHTKQQQPS